MNVNDITSVGCLDNHDGSIALAICLSGQIQPVFVTISKEELERSGGINGLNERKQDAVDFFSKYGEGRPVPPQIVRGNPRMTQFIATQHKLARLWVEACGKSLAIERAEAAAMYANLCGFRISYPRPKS